MSVIQHSCLMHSGKKPAFVKADHYDDVVFLGSSFCTGHTGVTLVYFAPLIDIVHVNSVWAVQ